MKENYRNDPINREDIGKYFPEIFDVFSHKADGKYAFIMNIKNMVMIIYHVILEIRRVHYRKKN